MDGCYLIEGTIKHLEGEVQGFGEEVQQDIPG
jgi:hypothetical protein